MGTSTPNIILVVVDALRRDRVGAISNGRTLTPNIDALAMDGTVFENAFAATNATDPSITSMHTGQDPNAVVTHHGPYVTDEEKQRVGSVDTVPELVRESGYRTIASGRSLGRWHKTGFDEYPEEALDVRRRRTLGQFLERFHPSFRSAAGKLYERIIDSFGDVSDENEIDALLSSITEEPFYGFVHMMDPHMPCDPAPGLIQKMLEKNEYPNQDLESFFENHQDSQYVSEFLRDCVTETDFEVGLARLFARYDGSVVEADKKIGQLVDGLRRRDLLEETILIVVSDHGESLDEHGIYFDHHGLYDPSIQVPMVVYGSNVPSTRRDELVLLPDLAPTILDYANINVTHDGIGRTLRPLLDDTGQWDNRDSIVLGEAQAQRRVAIRTERYKYIKHIEDSVLEQERGSSLRCGYCNIVHGGVEELYDLVEDPTEEHDIVEERPDLAAELESSLDSYLATVESDSESKDGDRLVEYEDEQEVLDRLEDLGYM